MQEVELKNKKKRNREEIQFEVFFITNLVQI